MLKIQEKLRNGMSIEEVERQYRIKAKRHPKYNNLVMFKYDQINSDFSIDIVRECRGLILDEGPDWAVVSCPFLKFFNFGEPSAAQIDWATAKVYEKIDGSLMTLYHYDGQWQVASNGMPSAAGDVNGVGISFEELFWRTFNDTGMVKPYAEYADLTFMFEMTGPYNRVVVPHQTHKLTLLGVRDRETLQEQDVEDVPKSLNWPLVKSFPITNMPDLVKTFDQFDGIDMEGYVVVDKDFNRIKIKHPGYVTLHHLRGNDGPTPKRMLGLVLSNESPEVLAYFPEWGGLYQDAKAKFDALVQEIESDFVRITQLVPSGLDSKAAQKHFASFATKTKCPSVLFLVRSGKYPNVKDALTSMGIDFLSDLLGLKAV